MTVIDRGKFGCGASHANCGLVCPSHVLPLAEPGAVSKALRALFTPNSPFSIKPRLDPGLWAWLVRFALRANRRDMLSAAQAIQSLLQSSAEIYPQLIADAQLDCEWQQRGLLFAYRSPEEMNAYAATDAILNEHFGLPAQRLGGEKLRELEPALRPGLAGGWFYGHDVHLRPDRLMSALRNVLEHQGVVICENCEADRLRHVDWRRKATAVLGAERDFEADAFVLATGAWTPQFQKQLGCRIPIQPGKGYSITMPRPKTCPTIPIIFSETRVVVTPLESGLRLGSMMEFAGYDTSLERRRLDLLVAAPSVPGRSRLRAGGGRVVWLEADDQRRNPDHRLCPEVAERAHRRRAQHARPVDGPRHRQARGGNVVRQAAALGPGAVFARPEAWDADVKRRCRVRPPDGRRVIMPLWKNHFIMSAISRQPPVPRLNRLLGIRFATMRCSTSVRCTSKRKLQWPNKTKRGMNWNRLSLRCTSMRSSGFSAEQIDELIDTESAAVRYGRDK